MHLLSSLFILSLLSSSISAHLIEVTAGKKECFFEDLHINDKMTVTFQVADGGYLDIDFWASTCHISLHPIPYHSFPSVNRSIWKDPWETNPANDRLSCNHC
jgi:hypothetical protein